MACIVFFFYLCVYVFVPNTNRSRNESHVDGWIYCRIAMHRYDHGRINLQKSSLDYNEG